MLFKTAVMITGVYANFIMAETGKHLTFGFKNPGFGKQVARLVHVRKSGEGSTGFRIYTSDFFMEGAISHKLKQLRIHMKKE